MNNYHNPPWNTPESVATPLLPQPSAPTARLGDALAAFFARLGIRKHKGCGCDQRQAWINRNQATVYLIVGMAVYVAFAGVLAAWLA